MTPFALSEPGKEPSDENIMVSHDCGISYHPLMKSDSVDELVTRTEKREDPLEDISWCRWYIENEDGQMDYEHISPIHKGILRLIYSFGKEPSDAPA